CLAPPARVSCSLAHSSTFAPLPFSSDSLKRKRPGSGSVLVVTLGQVYPGPYKAGSVLSKTLGVEGYGQDAVGPYGDLVVMDRRDPAFRLRQHWHAGTRAFSRFYTLHGLASSMFVA